MVFVFVYFDLSFVFFVTDFDCFVALRIYYRSHHLFSLVLTSSLSSSPFTLTRTSSPPPHSLSLILTPTIYFLSPPHLLSFILGRPSPPHLLSLVLAIYFRSSSPLTIYYLLSLILTIYFHSSSPLPIYFHSHIHLLLFVLTSSSSSPHFLLSIVLTSPFTFAGAHTHEHI